LRRKFDAGYGVKSLGALAAAAAFFEERRGRLIGFRWRDALDFSSAAPGAPVSALDQAIGVGDGQRKLFQLTKTYGAASAPYQRPIRKPVAGTVIIAVAGAPLPAAAVSVDATTGQVTLAVAPTVGAAVTAGFEFDVPVRFDTDELDIELSAFQAGDIPRIPLIEITG
jgi:uncharacterized protein (TIGR02217 family)